MEKLLLTGEPGIGKSTLIAKLWEKYPHQVKGIIAGEIRDASGLRTGFTSGSFEDPTQFVVAHVDNLSDIRVSRYGVDLKSLDEIAKLLSVQIEIAEREGLVLLFDEIGLIQSYSARLKEQIERVIRSEIPVILTIKQDDSVSEWLKEIKQLPENRLLIATRENRDQLLEELSQYIEKNGRNSVIV